MFSFCQYIPEFHQPEFDVSPDILELFSLFPCAVVKISVDYLEGALGVFTSVIDLDHKVPLTVKKPTYEVQDKILVAGDAQSLQQLLSILLDNAVKYCPAGGGITINLKETDKKNALLTVYNDGEPIPKEEIAQIFQRFYRVDQSRSAHGSFGLGLAIAESIVRVHRGKIWVENDGKNGNSFFVTLPLC